MDFRVKNGLVVATTATILGTTQSTSTTTGALIVSGGSALQGNLNVFGDANIGTTTKASLLTVNNTTTSAINIRSNARFISPNSLNTITVRMLDSDVLTFNGAAGQLFSISDSFTGTIFAVNDISGVPSIEVYDTGLVSLAEFTGNVGIGTTSTTAKLTVNGGASISGITSVTNTSNATSTTTGALQIVGGAGIGRDVWIGGSLNVSGGINATVSGTITTATTISVTNDTSTTLTQYISFVSGSATSPLGTALKIDTGELVFVPSTGRLGIGNTNPASKLDVTGDARISGITTVTNTTSAISTITGALQVAGGVGIGRDVWIGGSLNVAGTVNATASTASTIITVQSTSTNTHFLTFVDANNASATAESIYTTSSFVINPSTGNVGIGNTSPTVKLRISGGDVRLDNNRELQFLDTVGNVAKFALQADNNFVFYNSSGTPIWSATSATNSYAIFGGSSNNRIIIDAANSTTQFLVNGAERVRFNPGGNVGIGNTGPSAQLHVGTGSTDGSGINLGTFGHYYRYIQVPAKTTATATSETFSFYFGRTTNGLTQITLAGSGWNLEESAQYEIHRDWGLTSVPKIKARYGSDISEITWHYTTSTTDLYDLHLSYTYPVGVPTGQTNNFRAKVVTNALGINSYFNVASGVTTSTTSTNLIATDFNINASGSTLVLNTTSASSTVTGALQVAGGAGIQGDLYVYKTINVALATNGGTGIVLNNNDISGVNQIVFSDPGPGEGINFNSNFQIYESPDDLVTNTGGNLQFTANGVRRVTFNTNGQVAITTTTNATSTITGALIVAGGAGIGRDLYVGGTIYGNISGSLTGNAATVSTTQRTTDASHFLTFVDSNNASATAESIYTTSSFSINPSTQIADLTGTLRLRSGANFGDLAYTYIGGSLGYISTNANTGFRSGSGYFYGSGSVNNGYLLVSTYGTIIQATGHSNSDATALAVQAGTYTPSIAGYTQQIFSAPGTIVSTSATNFRGISTVLTDSSTVANTVIGIYADVSGGINTTATRYAATLLGGNVGVGTAAPSAKVHVVSSGTTSYTSTLLAQTLSDVMVLENPDQTVDGYTGLMMYHKSNNIAMGRIALYGNFFGSPNAALTFGLRPNSGSGGTVERMRIKDDGNIGIGTTDPLSTLHVAGTARITGVTTVTNTTNATSTSTGALQVAGGAGIGRDLYVGGAINSIGGPIVLRDATTSSIILASLQQQSNTVVWELGRTDLSNSPAIDFHSNSGTDFDARIMALNGSTTTVGQARLDLIANQVYLSSTQTATSTQTGALRVVGGVGIGGDLYVGGDIVAQKLTIQLTTITTTLVQTDDIIQTNNTTNAVSTTTGALIVAGGAGIGQDLRVGGTIYGTINGTLVGNAATVSTVERTNTTTHFLTFVDSNNSSASAESVYTTGSFVINPSTGNVGIGTTTATAKLHTLGSTGIFVERSFGAEFVQMGFNGSTSTLAYYPTLDIGYATTNNFGSYARTMTLTSGNNVGIGVTNPVQKLEVNGSIRTIAGSGGFVSVYETDATRANHGVFAADANGVYLNSTYSTGGSGVLRFLSANTERMRIDSSGNVGINTTSSSARLHVNGNTLIGGDGVTNYDFKLQRLNSGIRAVQHDFAAATNSPWILHGENLTWTGERAGTVESTQAFRPYYEAFAPVVGYKEFGFVNTTTGNFTSTNLIPNISLTNTGNVGIGTSSPNARLNVSAGNVYIQASGTYTEPATVAGVLAFDSVNGDFNISARSNGGNTFMRFFTSSGGTGNERMRIFSNGNVAINTTTNSSFTLEVNGSFAATTKSFVIPHPTKAGMKLRYGSLEGPENGVYVRGRLTNNNTIELPDYWIKLVDPESITVNLTPLGRHQNLYVENISDNKVTVGNSNLLNKEINCFYTVFAERRDVEKLQVEIY